MTEGSPDSKLATDFAETHTDRNRDSAEQLLNQGFSPAMIVWITGCDAAWIEALYKIKLRAPGQQ